MKRAPPPRHKKAVINPKNWVLGEKMFPTAPCPKTLSPKFWDLGLIPTLRIFFFGQETCRYYLRPALALLAPILPRAHPAWLSPSVLPQWRCKAASLALLLAWRHRSQPRLREGEERASADLTMRTSLYAAQRVVSLGTQFTAPAQGKCSASVASGPSLLGALYDRPRPALRKGRAVPSIGDAGTFELEA
jgi:hypothetical protein